ncbi:MAG TPA: YbaK/EbsC family protein [Myxococcales bacterium]|jgi:Ala-tRNA(Pro) deacylase|nr:YbaK/EbsC family protein [Myxococcales bacterium]
MIAQDITDYLERHGVQYVRYPHQRAVDGQSLAAALRISGWQVAKSILVYVDERPYLFVLPTPEQVSLERAAEVVGGSHARLANEDELAEVFPDYEVGAEPPFGSLHGVKVVMEERLLARPRMVVRAGSHGESLELSTRDFFNLERPQISVFGIRADVAHAIAQELST